MENSKIEWTDHTFNPWMGCQKVAPGCTHCYAEAFSKRYGKAKWGNPRVGTRVVTSDSYWAKPVAWNRQAEKAGVRRRVFCASLADVFEYWHGPMLTHDGERCFEEDERQTWSTMDDVRGGLFSLIDSTPSLDWLLLTKRPENVQGVWPFVAAVEYTPEAGLMNEYAMFRRENVWIGTSISDQETAAANVPALLELHELAPVLFLSAEPLLGPVDLSEWLTMVKGEWRGDAIGCRPAIGWVIVGGESGPGSRPMEVQWARDLRDQCVRAGVPFFFKQWGTHRGSAQHRVVDGLDGGIQVNVKSRLLDGREWNQFPEPAAQPVMSTG